MVVVKKKELNKLSTPKEDINLAVPKETWEENTFQSNFGSFVRISNDKKISS